MITREKLSRLKFKITVSDFNVKAIHYRYNHINIKIYHEDVSIILMGKKIVAKRH